VITSSLWRGKRYAVLGLARSGLATVDALLASGAEVVAWDANARARAALAPLHDFVEGSGVAPFGEQEPKSRQGGHPQPLQQGLEGSSLSFVDPLTLDLTGFAGVVVSPGVPLNRHPIAGHAAKYGVPIIGDIELFAQARAELPPHKVVGITGTNGKSTTTALVHHILKTAGVPTTMGGNIGLPILAQEPLPEGGVYALELSSFQIDLTFTLDCDVAVLLNITPDHLDRYASFEAYAAAKVRLFEMQTAPHDAILTAHDFVGDQQVSELVDDAIGSKAIVQHTVGPGVAVDRDASLVAGFAGWDGKYFSQQADWPALQGPHNGQNAVAAISACRALHLTVNQIAAGLRTYPGLPHRMERVRERDGVLFVNDSKATNPTSTAPALAAYPALHWILGGQAKTDELDACAPHFGHVRAAYTIGDSAAMFADLLRPHMSVEESGTLAKAVTSAAAAAKAGETVLLSPACASFDQFRDFEDRGDQFRALVGAL
jgi:UDP-N-acetylmuramoylalanine--D-glutamate ligase